MDFSVCNLNLKSPPESPCTDTAEYQRQLATRLFASPTKKVLTFQQPLTEPATNVISPIRLQLAQPPAKDPLKKIKRRRITPTAERILDAPDILDDFYLNVLDWSSQDMIAVALNTSVYLWNASSGDVSHLVNFPESTPVTSLSWSPEGFFLALGLANSEIQLWDITRQRKVRDLTGHRARVGCLAWADSQLSSGSRDTRILCHDLRAERMVSSFVSHTQEVCGIRYSFDGTQLASGGNDNKVAIWETRCAQNSCNPPRVEFKEHTAAVRALGWAPFQRNLLATGSGSADRSIRFWDTTSATCVKEMNAGSQVCTLLWSLHSKEFVTSHGFSEYQLSVWQYPSLTKLADLTGHQSRVLYTALSPDGSTVVSGAGDETLRFWKVFEPMNTKGKRPRETETRLSESVINIR